MVRAGQEEARDPLATDLADVRATLAGDQEAYERVVRRYQQQIGNFLWKFTHNATDHEDLVHATFVEAYVSLAKFRGRGSFRGWLLTIATRVGYAYWKEQARARSRNEDSLESVPEPAIYETEGAGDLERLEMVLASMATRDRLVLTLLYLEEHSVAETASLTGWSKSMVKVQAHRARKKLKKLFENGDDETRRS